MIKLQHSLTHEIMDETLSTAPVDKYDSFRIHMSDVHGWTLHLGIGEAHLQVDIVNILQKI